MENKPMTPHPMILIPGLAEIAVWAPGGPLVRDGDGQVLAFIHGDAIEIASHLGRVHAGLVRVALVCLRNRGFEIPEEK